MFGTSFRRRRHLSIAVVAIALVLTAFWTWVLDSRLAHASYFTGSVLLACVLLLLLIGVRRRLPVLPLGSVSTWTQVHLYTGLFAFGVFFLHVPAIIPNGIFESTLSFLFLSVSISGVYGIYASRQYPKRLTAVEGQHRFDQVGWHRTQIAMQADSLLGELSESSALEVLGNFFQTHLRPFFGHRPSLAYVLVPTGTRRRRLLGGLKELDRYLEGEGRQTAGQMAALVRRRDDLDYQFAVQLRLRVWLVFHGCLSILLVGAGLIHTAMAIRFAG